MEVCIFGVLTVNLLTPILFFSFQSASFFSWQASYIKTEKCLILRQIRGLNDDQREASMPPHEGAINASRRKNWCVAMKKILRRDGKNNASRWKKTAILQPFFILSRCIFHFLNRKAMS